MKSFYSSYCFYCMCGILELKDKNKNLTCPLNMYNFLEQKNFCVFSYTRIADISIYFYLKVIRKTKIN